MLQHPKANIPNTATLGKLKTQNIFFYPKETSNPNPCPKNHYSSIKPISTFKRKKEKQKQKKTKPQRQYQIQLSKQTPASPFKLNLTNSNPTQKSHRE
jgi:hypothetical protein